MKRNNKKMKEKKERMKEKTERRKKKKVLRRKKEHLYRIVFYEAHDKLRSVKRGLPSVFHAFAAS